jgi:aminoglycoside phosphotransferase (APT) family kinase protein
MSLQAAREREALLLPHLAGRLSVAALPLERRGDHGRPLDAAAAALPAIPRHIGAILGDLHAIRLPWTVHRYLPLITAMDWRRSSLQLHQELRENIFPQLDPPERERAAQVWQAHLKNPANFRIRLALIHGDLRPEHILCNPAAGRVTALAGWGQARIGDPALDFAGLLQAGGEPAVRLALEAYPHVLGASFWPRLIFYNTIYPYVARLG